MKQIYIANIMEFTSNGEIINEWRLHFLSEEQAKEQLKNAKEIGLDGYIHSYTIEDSIINFKLIRK